MNQGKSRSMGRRRGRGGTPTGPEFVPTPGLSRAAEEEAGGTGQKWGWEEGEEARRTAVGRRRRCSTGPEQLARTRSRWDRVREGEWGVGNCGTTTSSYHGVDILQNTTYYHYSFYCYYCHH